MAQQRLIRRALWAVLVVLMPMASGCAELSLLKGPMLPASAAMPMAVTYRDLATIPVRPFRTGEEENRETSDALDADRAATAEAANRLKAEPFEMPAPAPPPVEIKEP